MIDAMIEEAGSIGKSGELALCAPLQQEMTCFIPDSHGMS